MLGGNNISFTFIMADDNSTTEASGTIDERVGLSLKNGLVLTRVSKLGSRDMKGTALWD